jgi:thiol-disulfide isomerase/thioredoxin
MIAPRAMLMALLAITLLGGNAAQAGDPRHFTSGSLKRIVAAHSGKPFILGLWSLTCTHCREELAMLGQLVQKYPHASVVLISTDTPGDAGDVASTLNDYSLGSVESWVFADSYTERLRFEIDNKWHGELPRTYLYDSNAVRSAHSGKLDLSLLESWLQKQGGVN